MYKHKDLPRKRQNHRPQTTVGWDRGANKTFNQGYFPSSFHGEKLFCPIDIRKMGTTLKGKLFPKGSYAYGKEFATL